MTDRRTLIWEEGAQKGSNVDVGAFHELDHALSELYGSYDTALDLWAKANEEYTDAKIEFVDVQHLVHEDLRDKYGDTITRLKREVELDKRTRKASKKLMKAEAVREFGSRLITKIETQRSMVQSRVKMLMSQSKWDRGSQLD